MPAPTVAVSIIGHNNGHQLERCLGSVRWADEIVYVDCASADGSADIARRYTGKVFHRPNNTNLNINKTFGFEQATSDWIFYLDPDEVIPEELAREVRAVIGAGTPANAFELPRRNHYFGRWLRHGGKYPDLQLRLFRRGKARFACRHVHEKLEVDGATGRLREAMWHYPSESVHEAIRKMDFYSTFNAEQIARKGVRPGAATAWSYLFARPADRFLRRYLLKGGFLDGWPGFIVATIDGIDFPFRFFKLWYLATHPEALPPAPSSPEPAPPAPVSPR